MYRKQMASVFAATALCFAGVAAADPLPGKNINERPLAAEPAPVDLGNTVCPVSGDKVGDSKLVETYEGKIYHFCCDDCPTAFKKDPAKYAKLVADDPAKYGVKGKS